MHSQDQLRKHHHKHHRVVREPSDDSNFDLPDDSVMAYPPQHPLNNVVVGPTQLMVCLQTDFGEMSSICTFLTNATSINFAHAVKCIMARTLWNTNVPNANLVACLTRSDMLQYFSMAHLVYQIGSTGRQMLGQLMQCVYSQASPRTSSGRHSSCDVPWPTTAAKYRSVFLDRAYRTSLAASLPILVPVAKGLQDFTLVPREFVLYALAFGKPCDTNHRYAILVKTPPAKVLYPNQGLSALISIWMDDFDANMSLSKLNRNGVFGVVGTVMFVDSTGKLVAAYSNLLAVGKKKDSHEGILASIGDACTGYGGLHYCGALNQCVPLQAHLLQCVCDQPAKRDLCGLKQGNGKFHACFGYSIYFKALQRQFEACAHCQERLLHTDTMPLACATCHAWKLPADGSYLVYASPLYDNLVSDIPQLLALNRGGGKLTMSLLLATWNECWSNLQNGSHTLLEVRDKLDLVCINQHYQNVLIECWRHTTAWNEIQNGSTTCPDYIEEIEELHAQQPELFCQPKAPEVWNYSKLSQWVEAPMHLQMGIIKTVAGMIQTWAHDRGHGPTLATYIQQSLLKLQLVCRVDKQRIVNYTPNMAGWVADNCRSLCLWMPWIYRVLTQDQFTYHPYQQPNRPWPTWRKAECVGFIRARNVPIDNRNLSELKAQIEHWMNQEGGPPPPVIPLACQITGADMLAMVWHCHRMFKSLFDTQVEPEMAKLCVYRFLTAMNKIDSTLRPTLDNAKYISTYNMVSLLRAVDQAAARKSMRYYQEGGQDGEGIVKPLRALLPPNLPPRFASNLLTNLYRQTVLNDWVQAVGGTPVWPVDIEDGEEPQSNNEDALDLTLPAVAHAFRRYPSTAMILQFLNTGTPLSLVFVRLEQDQTCFGCVTQLRKQWTLHPVEAHYHHSVRHQFPYFTLLPKFDSSVELRTLTGNCVAEIVACGYALPGQPVNDNAQSHQYGIITDELYHLNSTGQFE